jgi:ketosteroid isomerase-like protein
MTAIPAAPVKNFIDATNRHDAEALLAVFAPNATVTDDGTTYSGSTHIQSWIREHQIAPKITLDPTAYDEVDGRAVQLTAFADGDFPGGPLAFTFRFTLDAEKVTTLDVRFAE